MISLKQKPNLCQIREPADDKKSAAQLRFLRNNFLKHSSVNNQELAAEDLTALLLYFALRFLEKGNGLQELVAASRLKGKTITELMESELVSLGNDLFHALKQVLPANLRDVMVVPNIVSWQKAGLFYAKHNDDDIFSEIANLGFAYQIFGLAARKARALPALQRADKKISRQELIAFTQLYTPSWVVDFLVANAILPNCPKEKVSQRYSQWLLDKDRCDNKIELNDLTVLDPACGAGQFLFSAFDLLLELHKQKDFSKEEAAKSILAQNIFGADIDEKALWVAGLGLLSQSLVAGNFIPDNLLNLAWITVKDIDKGSKHTCENSDQKSKAEVSDSSFLGSIDSRLSADHLLKGSYQIIVTNPPYLGRKCLSRELKTALKEQYPNSSADLSTAFFERCLKMLKPGGSYGVITQSSMLSIPSYQDLRNYLMVNYSTDIIVRCGPGVFPLCSGEKIDSILLVARAPLDKTSKNIDIRTFLIDLTQEKYKSRQLRAVTNAAARGDNEYVVYKDKSELRTSNDLFSKLSSNFYTRIAAIPKLGDIAEIRQGLATTDNARFVRYHFDVADELIGSEWVPYIKGAGGERFASNNPFVVKWGNKGKEIKEAVAKAYPYLKGKTAWVVKNEEFYFRPGLCFSFINKAGLAVRRLPAGAIFDVASSAIFAPAEEEDFLLAYLNSTLVSILAKSINQTINLQVGDLKKIPVFPFPQTVKDKLSTLGRRAFEVKQKLLQLQKFDLVQDDVCSARGLDLLFDKYVTENRTLIEELESLQKTIDYEVPAGIKQLGILSDEEEKFFQNSRNYLSAKKSQPPAIDSKLFASKVLVALVAKLISHKDGERIVLASIAQEDSLSQILNISDSAREWLEDKFGKSLEQLFCQTKVFDICKLAGDPSRYFSLWFADSRSCMVFSAAAIRPLLKSHRLTEESFLKKGSIRPEYNPINMEAARAVLLLIAPMLVQLRRLGDWTSKDFLKILSA